MSKENMQTKAKVAESKKFFLEEGKAKPRIGSLLGKNLKKRRKVAKTKPNKSLIESMKEKRAKEFKKPLVGKFGKNKQKNFKNFKRTIAKYYKK